MTSQRAFLVPTLKFVVPIRVFSAKCVFSGQNKGRFGSANAERMVLGVPT